MVFSSNIFLLYFLPVVLLVYFLTPRKYRNYTLLTFSLAFYAYGAPDFFFYLVGSVVVNFYVVKAMFGAKQLLWKKIFCGISIALNLSLLLYFKYSNFFMWNINAVLGFIHRPEIPWMAVALPIGISFFTFQSITYTLDTYRNVNSPMKKLTDYMLYITMFPQLIAGPIVRYCDVADQIRERYATMSYRLQGFYRFVLGLSKKVLIADVIGFYVDKILASSDYSALDSSTAWVTIVAYTFQLYFDFAGYSDMAIGLGRMMGFKFPENFDNPYVSTSISEFWRRWHQTFSIFMKNYLYFPLGGSRVKTKFRLYFNLWFVFLLSGLWHGASWNFVIYGIIQGIFIVMDRLFLVKIMSRLGKIPSVLFTFLIIVLARVFFRIENIGMAWTFMQKLFAFDFAKVDAIYDLQSYVTIAIAAFFSFITLSKFGLKLQNKVYFTEYKLKGHILFWILSLIGFAFCLASLNAVGFSPFIYFRF
jgi:alginate O-acetyltransferase complex protein AlgI